ncbi:3-oxoacyl-[acyl-carrier-protein] synthase III [Anaerolineae bacterium]|nr:3-oxoacyl-[acyl-carrier-protein] synthase III [Anaerolineae bacterium]
MPPERYAKIAGWGKYVPERVLTNADLEKMVDTSDEWITQRTGIKERHLRTEKDTNSSMAVAASIPAIEMAGLTAEDLDLIIVATSSPDYLLPPVSSQIQHMLGAECGAFQLGAGCSGWVYALTTADQFIKAGGYNNILVVGVEIISFALDYTDRTTCVLFGDAAAAVVLTATDQPSGVLAFELGSDGSGAESLIVPAAGSTKPINQEAVENREQFIRMDGQAVFKFATRAVAGSLKRVVAQAGLLPDDIALFIPHQANARIIEAGAKLLRQPLDKFYVNVHKYGNTSAASVPLAMVEAIEEGRLKSGDKVAMVAFGAGLTWAAVVVQMGEGEISPAHTLFSAGRAAYLAKKAQNRVLDGVQAALLPLYTWRHKSRKRK